MTSVKELCTEDSVGPVGLCYNCPEYIITANLLSLDLKFKEHMRDLSNKLGLFMVSVSVGVYQFDGFLGFHMDLLALCDGEISVLRRDKAANLFSVLQICRQRFQEGWRRILLCCIAWWRD